MNPMMVRGNESKKRSQKILGEVALKRLLYDRVDDLIAPETLQQLTGDAVISVCCTPIEGGYSGSRLLAVETNGNHSRRFVLKRMGSKTDWLMQSSDDHNCRSVALWQYGILDQLQPTVDHAILSCARDGDGWAILMRDVSPNLLGRVARETEIKFFLDTLATIHATFWEAPELDNPALGLCDTAGIIQAFSLESARRLPSDTNPNPRMISEGWELLQEWLDPDVADRLAELHADPQPLSRALARYPATLVHGDYRYANLALQTGPGPQAIVLDWQLAGRSAATIDLVWFLSRFPIGRSSFSLETGVAYYRQRLEECLGHDIDPAQWQPMLELGMLVDKVRNGAIQAWFAAHTTDEASRSVHRRVLKQLNTQVRVGLRWL
jgi:hypothetical protein